MLTNKLRKEFDRKSELRKGKSLDEVVATEPAPSAEEMEYAVERFVKQSKKMGVDAGMLYVVYSIKAMVGSSRIPQDKKDAMTRDIIEPWDRITSAKMSNDPEFYLYANRLKKAMTVGLNDADDLLSAGFIDMRPEKGSESWGLTFKGALLLAVFEPKLYSSRFGGK